MSIQPAVVNDSGTLAGVWAGINENARRISMLEATRGSVSGLDGAVIAPGTIPGSSIQNDTITANQIAANTITASEIQANSITTAALQAGSVTASIISAGAINAGHIQAGSITATQIATDTITANNIAAGAITASEIQTAAITATHIAAGTITADRIAAGTITATQLAADSITTAKIQAGAVTSDKITTTTLAAISTNMGSITAGTITGATVQTGTTGSRVVIDSLGIRGYALDGTTKVFEIAVGSGIASFTGVATLDASSVIPGAAIVNASITDAKVVGLAAAKVTGQITQTQITDGAISSPKLAAGAVTAGKITAGTIVTADISAGGVNADRLVSGSIQTLQIAAGAITANTIAAGAITAQKLSVTFGGNNVLYNSQLSYWPSTDPDGWARYDNVPGTGSGTWSKITAGGPNGENSWRVVYSGAVQPKGFVSAGSYMPARADTSYVISWWWKGDRQPDIASNVTFDLDNTWLLNPATSASVWQRYARRVKSSQNGLSGSGRDYTYIYGIYAGGVSGDVQITNIQREEGETLSMFAPAPSEVLPGSVGNTQIAPNAITTDKILAGTILAGDIAAGTITGNEIQATSIGASKLNVATLSAITADMGTITAGTITGGIIRTAASGARVQLDSVGFRQFASDGVTALVTLPSNGTDAVFTGVINAKGISFPATSGFSTTSAISWPKSYISGTCILTSPMSGSVYLQAEGGGTAATSSLTVTSTEGVPSLVGASAGSKSVVLIQSDGQSGVWRQPGDTSQVSSRKMQSGSFTISIPVSASPQEIPVTLGTAWGTSHSAFICSAAPAANWSGFSVLGSGTYGATTTGYVAIMNTVSAQNVEFAYISIGY